MADIRDHVRIIMINEYLGKIETEFKRMYHNAKISNWPEVDDQEEFGWWLGDQVLGVCEYLNEETGEDIYTWGRSGATITTEDLWTRCPGLLRLDVGDWAYSHDVIVDVKELDDSVGLSACDSLDFVKEEYKKLKLINDTVIGAAKHIREDYNERDSSTTNSSRNYRKA